MKLVKHIAKYNSELHMHLSFSRREEKTISINKDEVQKETTENSTVSSVSIQCCCRDVCYIIKVYLQDQDHEKLGYFEIRL